MTPDGHRDETTFSTIKNYISPCDVFYRGNSIHDETTPCYLNIDWYITGLVIVVVLYYSTSLSLYKIIFQFFFLSWYFFSVCATKSLAVVVWLVGWGKIAERCHASEKNVCAFLHTEKKQGEFFSISFIWIFWYSFFMCPVLASNSIGSKPMRWECRREDFSIFYDGHFFSLINSSLTLSAARWWRDYKKAFWRIFYV